MQNPDGTIQNTLFTGDNLFILNGMNSNSVDLIYLDPPFNSKRLYSGAIGSKAADVSFKDMWTWEDVNEEYLDKLMIEKPSLVKFIQSIGDTHSKAMMAYITYMTQRVIQMYRILKDTGSIYLHCDPTASHYLKIMLDEIFGRKNFKNEIVWERTTDTGSSKAIAKFFPRNNDIILFYSKSEHYFYNKIFLEYSNEYIKSKFKEIDEKGIDRWQLLSTYSDETFQKLKQEGKLKKTEKSILLL
jgi:site-specific DNA-methyltransferase (adenine-specific)